MLFLESPEKPFVKHRPAYSVKVVFSYVVKGIKIKITAKFCARDAFVWRYKDFMSPEVHPKSFGTFNKQAPGPQVSLHLTGPQVITCCQLTEMAILLKMLKFTLLMYTKVINYFE